MGSLGFQEVFVILLLALLIFGPKKLPEIGRAVGNAMRELRKMSREFSSSVEELDLDENDSDSERG